MGVGEMGHGVILLSARTCARLRKFQPVSHVRAWVVFWMLAAGAALTLIGDSRVARAYQTPRLGAYELGLQTGYGFGVTNNAQMVTFLPRATRVFAVTDLVLGEKTRVPGIWTFGVEGLFSRILESS